MSNKRCVLSINLEPDEELLNDIDSLLRERARAIIRQEAEVMLGGELKSEAKRLAAAKIESFNDDTIVRILKNGFCESIRWDDNARGIFGRAIKAWCEDDELYLRKIIKDFASVHIRSLAKSGLLEAAVEALKEEMKDSQSND